MPNTISYCGTIEHLDGERVFVRIAERHSCTECKIKSVCIKAGGEEEIIEAVNCAGESLAVNEPVMISGKRSMNRLSVAIAFIIPLILIISTIVVANSLLGLDEGVSALAGITVLTFWYFGVYLLRKTLDKKFIFTVKKIEIV